MSKPRRSTKAVDGGGGESEDKAKGNKSKSPKKGPFSSKQNIGNIANPIFQVKFINVIYIYLFLY